MMFAILTACVKMQTGCVKMLTGFHTVKTGNKQNVNVFRRFNGKPLMYVFPWKVTHGDSSWMTGTTETTTWKLGFILKMKTARDDSYSRDDYIETRLNAGFFTCSTTRQFHWLSCCCMLKLACNHYNFTLL